MVPAARVRCAARGTTASRVYADYHEKIRRDYHEITTRTPSCRVCGVRLAVVLRLPLRVRGSRGISPLVPKTATILTSGPGNSVLLAGVRTPGAGLLCVLSGVAPLARLRRGSSWPQPGPWPVAHGMQRQEFSDDLALIYIRGLMNSE